MGLAGFSLRNSFMVPLVQMKLLPTVIRIEANAMEEAYILEYNPRV